MTQQAMVSCNNCGRVEPLTYELSEVTYMRIDGFTVRTSCPACGSYVIMRAWDFDEMGNPISGEMLVVKTSLKLKGASKND